MPAVPLSRLPKILRRMRLHFWVRSEHPVDSHRFLSPTDDCLTGNLLFGRTRQRQEAMRHVPLCLFVPFVLACGGPTEPFVPPSIRLEGTVTAVDDGSPITGARLTVWVPTGVLTSRTISLAITDASGRYSASFTSEMCSYRVDVDAPLFSSQFFFGRDIGCEYGVHTLDVQLERIPT
jgi:hypothetical protein